MINTFDMTNTFSNSIDQVNDKKNYKILNNNSLNK